MNVLKEKSLLSWVRHRFLRYDTKHAIHKRKKMITFIKIKNFCSLKYTVKRIKRQTETCIKFCTQNI